MQALTKRGFDRLTDALRSAADLHTAGRADVEFAHTNPALLSLMRTAKADRTASEVHTAAQRLFTVTSTLVRTACGPRVPEDARVEQLTLVLSATIQGISSFVSTGRIAQDRGEALLVQAIDVFIAGALDASPEPAFP